LKRTLGEYNFAGQYQQAPAPLGGGVVKWEWKVHAVSTLEPPGQLSVSRPAGNYSIRGHEGVVGTNLADEPITSGLPVTLQFDEYVPQRLQVERRRADQTSLFFELAAICPFPDS